MADIIKVKNLTKKFKSPQGEFTAVDNIFFTVKKGEIFGFLGPNGAGKSTTIRMLTTLLRPTSGVATIADYDIEKQQDEVRKRIGLVAEKIILYSRLTADENLKFFGRLHHLPEKLIKERADKWLQRLHMEEWRDRQAGTYSTGMKQRISIICALLTEPDVLFLDEPTLGLDPQTTKVIRDFLQELNKQGITIILTTHDMVEAEALSDRVAIIDQGKIAALGTVAELKKKVKKVKKVKNPTLGDAFLEITGREIRDSATGRTSSVAGSPWARQENKRAR